MIIPFDKFGKQEPPILTLYNYSEPIYSLGAAYNVKTTLRFGAISELEFDYPQKISPTDSELPAYKELQAKKIIKAENVGFFIISERPEQNTGSIPSKHVICQSLESELSYKRIVASAGTYKFYDYSNPRNTILGKALRLAPNWTIGHIDEELLSIYRTFDVTNNTLYNFLTQDVSNAYGCIFTFDTFSRTISAYLIENINTESNVYISLNNFAKDITITEYSDELCTALYCYGGNGLDIRSVNPLGGNVLYNFDYFINPENGEWVSENLRESIIAWRDKVNSKKGEYKTLVFDRNSVVQNAVDLKTDILNSRNSLDAALIRLEGLVASGSATAEELSIANADIRNLRSKILILNQELEEAQISIENKNSELRKISNSLEFTSQDIWDNFYNDISVVKDNFENLLKTWNSVYYSTADAITLNVSQLNEEYPEISEKFSSTYNLIGNLKSWVSIVDSNVYGMISTDYWQIMSLIEDTTKALKELRTALSNLIPYTTVTTELSTEIIILESYAEIITYEENFTKEEFTDLQAFIFENTYTNDNLIITDQFTEEQKIEEAQKLYDQAEKIIERVSKPRFEISGNFVNAFYKEETRKIIEELDLGKKAQIEIGDGQVVESILLEINFSYDNPEEFNMVFSNRVKLNNSNFKFADMFISIANGSSGLGGITGSEGISSAAQANTDISGEFILDVSHALISKLGYVSFGANPPQKYGNNQGVWLGYDNAPKVSLYSDENNYFQWDGTKLLVKARNFTLDSLGNITATNATLSGNISALTGSIGGWEISDTSLYADSGSMVLNSAIPAIGIGEMQYYLGGIGIFLGKDNNLYKFAVGNPGGDYFAFDGENIVSRGNWLGGWILDENRLHNGTAGSHVELNTTGGEYPAISAGSETIETAPFRIYHDGRLYAENAYISGEISAEIGNIAGWEITETKIKKDRIDGVTSVYLDSAPGDGVTSPIRIFAGYNNPGEGKFFEVFEDGTMVSSGAVISGEITAILGSIGGWSITENGLTSGDENTPVGMSSTGTYAFYAGNSPSLDYNFSVTKSGALKAYNANIEGTITATFGNIGGWAITSDGLTNSNIGLLSSFNYNNIGIYAGNPVPNLAPFRVTYDGSLYSSSGDIGGWKITSGSFVSPNNMAGIVGIPENEGDFYFFAGHTNPDNAPFRVDTFGKLFATEAKISGEINAGSGNIGGWVINGGSLFSENGNIELNSEIQQIIIEGSSGGGISISGGENSFIRSLNYSNNASGFRIEGRTGNAEFNNILARGEIRSTVFTYDEISANSGTLGVFKAAGILKNDITVPQITDYPNTFYINIGNNKNVLAFQYFDINDIIRLKDAQKDAWAKILSAELIEEEPEENQYYRYNCQTLFGGGHTFTEGQTVIDYGQVEIIEEESYYPGYLLMSADGQYYSVNIHKGDPWNYQKTPVRMGNLDGFWGFGKGAYGIAIGDETGNHLTYDTITSVLNINGAITLGEGSNVPWDIVTNTPAGFDIIKPPTSGSAGLYIDSTHLGYYDGDNWAIYIDNNGNFVSGDGTSLSSPSLSYSSGSLILRQAEIRIYEGDTSVINITPGVGFPSISIGNVISSGSTWEGSGTWMGKTINGYSFFAGNSQNGNIVYNGQYGLEINGANMYFGLTSGCSTMEIGTNNGMPFISMGDPKPQAWNDKYADGIFMGRDPTTAIEYLLYENPQYTQGYILQENPVGEIGKIIVGSPRYVFRVGSIKDNIYMAWDGTSLKIFGAEDITTESIIVGNPTTHNGEATINGDMTVTGTLTANTGISHSSLSGLDTDNHTQYLNTTRHDTTDRHTLGTVVPHDDHGSLSGLNDDDHTQYLNTTRHDTTTRHTLGTVVPHDDHGSLSGLNDDDHPQYLLRTDKAADSDKLDGVHLAAFLGLNDLADPNADRVLFWDDSAGALKWLTVEGIVGTDLGKWQSYTVSWTASTTNPAIGNGTLNGKYVQIGKIVTCNIYMIPGSNTTFGSGNWSFSLPKAIALSTVGFVGNWVGADVGTNTFSGQVIGNGGTNKIEWFVRDGISITLSSTLPHTWESGDVLYISITYEIE